MVAVPEKHREEAVRRIEKEFARRNFVSPDGEQPDFLDHVKILERSQLHSGVSGGAIPFQKWPYLLLFLGFNFFFFPYPTPLGM